MTELEAQTEVIGDINSPLSEILRILHTSHAASEAPNEQLKAHVLGISLAKLSNVLRIDKFTDAEILLLDEHGIDLPKAARLAMLNEEIRLNCMNSDFLSSLAKSERPLSDIWLEDSAETIDDDEMFAVFKEEKYLERALNSRASSLGQATTRWEKTLRSIMSSVNRSSKPSKKQMQAIKSGIIGDSDTAYLWSSNSLRNDCPKSVSFVDLLLRFNENKSE